jgi:hypothetical protein
MANFTHNLIVAGLSATLLLGASSAGAVTIHHAKQVRLHHQAFALQRMPSFSDTATLPGQCRPGQFWDMQKYSTDTQEMNTIPMPCHS